MDVLDIKQFEALRGAFSMLIGLTLGAVLGYLGFHVSQWVEKRTAWGRRHQKFVERIEKLEALPVVTTGTPDVESVLTVEQLEACWKKAEKDAPNIEDEYLLYGKYVANLAANLARQQLLLEAGEGTPSHRLGRLLDGLAKLFPEKVSSVSSRPPEPEYLEEIRKLLRLQKAAVTSGSPLSRIHNLKPAQLPERLTTPLDPKKMRDYDLTQAEAKQTIGRLPLV